MFGYKFSIKIDLRDIVLERCGLKSFVVVQRQLTGRCEQGNELSVPYSLGTFLTR
jgi:hypothetical protein